LKIIGIDRRAMFKSSIKPKIKIAGMIPIALINCLSF